MPATIVEAHPAAAAATPATYEIAPAPPQLARRHPLASLSPYVVAPPATRSRGAGAFGALLRFGAWAYFLGVLTVWLLMRLAAERWWPATMLLFAPRWNWATPLVILIPAALARRGHRALPPLIAAAGIVLFPIMDVRIPWRRLSARAAAMVRPAATAPAVVAPRLRLLTCNVHGLELDVPAFTRYLAECRPDLVALQGWLPQQHRAFIFPPSAGWHVAQDGQLCVASRKFAVTREAAIVPPTRGENGMTSAFAIHAESGFGGTFQLIDVHVDSPHRAFAAALCGAPGAAEMIETNTDRRLRHAMAIARYADGFPGSAGVMLSGDFNMPDDSPVYRRVFPAAGRWTDSFAAAGWGIGNTYFGGGTAARIDHVLCDGHDWRCVACTVGPAVGSPHRPVVAELEWVGVHREEHPAGRAVMVDVSH